MLGHCFAQKGMPQAAVTWFKKGLDAPGRSAEETKALKYELGAAYEQMGDLKSAVDGVYGRLWSRYWLSRYWCAAGEPAGRGRRAKTRRGK